MLKYDNNHNNRGGGVLFSRHHCGTPGWAGHLSSQLSAALSESAGLFLVGTTYAVTGLFGLFIFFLSTVVGLIAPVAGIHRTHAMGVLMLPLILRCSSKQILRDYFRIAQIQFKYY